MALIISPTGSSSLFIRTYRKLPAKAGLEQEWADLQKLNQSLADDHPLETLLIWEAESHCAVLPRVGASAAHLSAGEGLEVPVLRRESGGGAVLVGPGCLNYALVLSLERRPALLDVKQSYVKVLNGLLAALPLSGACAIGSDLVLDDRKFGGHAQRRTRHSLLHHGTILYDFDIRRIRNSLREPIRQPSYRRGRTHDHFVVNAPISLEALLEGLRTFAAGL